jgi:hypothetical protein
MVAVAAAAGCSSSPSGATTDSHFTVSTPPAASVGPAQSTTVGMTFPIDAYRATAAESLAINNSVQVLTGKCSSGFGVAYPVSLQANAMPEDNSRYYGVIDKTIAEQYGYEAPPNASGTASGGSGPQGAALTPDELTVITGWPDGHIGNFNHPPTNLTYAGKKIPAGGCVAYAGKEIGLVSNENPQDPTEVVNIAHAGGNLAQADPRVEKAFAAWSTCMSGQGYTYKSPWDPQDKDWPSPTTSEEINTAVADVTCKQHGNLVAIWYAVEVAYEKTLIQQNITALTEEKQHIDQVAAKAAQVLASGGN